MSAPNYPVGTPPAAYPGSYAPQAPPKKRKTWLIVLAIVVSLILLFIVGCCVLLFSYGKSHMAMSDQGAMLVLHQHMTKGEDAAIYDESDPLYKQHTTAAQSNEVFDRVHSVLGSPTHEQVMENKKQTIDGADVVDFYILTTFTNGTGNESIEFRRGADNMYHMTSYGIESDKMRQAGQ